MKIKKSKHVHHDRGYTPVVNCKLTSRRLVCGTETDIQGVAVAVAHPQKVDIEQMAHDISHYAVSTSYQKLADYVAHGEMEPVPRIKGCYRPVREYWAVCVVREPCCKTLL